MILRRATQIACSSVRAPNFLLAPTTSAVQTCEVHHHKERDDLQRYLGITRSNKARANRNTHVNEKLFRRMRGRKTVLVELPEDSDDQRSQQMTPQEMRIELLKKGVNPYKDVQPRTWNEAQITFQSIYGIADPYVPPENTSLFGIGDSGIVDGIKSKADEVKLRLQHKFHNWRNGVSRIRKKQGFEKFDVKAFPAKADDIYVQAHKALQSRDKTLLLKYITEYAFARMWPDVEKGSVVYEMVEKIEPSRVVAIRCFDNPPKSGNDIAQLTVRMHTRQKLAIYDRFGRLLLGSESEPKEVVEYVVFENHIAVVDGEWRLHGKVYPSWLPAKQGHILTQLLAEEELTALEAKAENLPLKAEEMEKQKKLDEKKEKEDEK